MLYNPKWDEPENSREPEPHRMPQKLTAADYVRWAISTALASAFVFSVLAFASMESERGVARLVQKWHTAMHQPLRLP